MPAMGTGQREIPCTPAQHKMSQPAHTFPFVTSRSNRRSQAEHRYMTRKSGKVSTTPVRFEWRQQRAPLWVPQDTGWDPDRASQRCVKCADLAFRGSPTMNRVPRRGTARPCELPRLARIPCTDFGTRFRLFRTARGSKDYRELSKAYRQISLVAGIG